MWSGMQGYVLADDLARIFNLPQARGVLVQGVAARSPAEHLGLRGGAVRANIAGLEFVVGGDVVLEVMGISLVDENSEDHIRDSLRALEPGDEWSVKVLRAGEIVELKKFYFPDRLVPEAASSGAGQDE